MQKSTIEKHFAGEFLSFYRHFIPSIKPGSNGSAQALCPFHRDKTPSMSIQKSTGLFHCHACGAEGSPFDFYALKNGLDARRDFNQVIAGIAETFNITETGPAKTKTTSKVVARYDYQDENGKVIYQKERMEPKDFRQRRPDGKGGWISGLGGTEKTLYHLPDILNATEIFVAEGEKDTDNVRALGFAATTSGGTNTWQKRFADLLIGKRVVLLPHNDEPGRKFMKDIGGSLQGKAASIKWLELPDLREKGDISDFIATFQDKDTAAERLSVMVEGAPEYKEQPDPPQPDAWDDQLFTLRDAYQDRPALEYIIAGLIPAGSLSIIYGPPGSLKSMLLADALVATAAGLSWLGRDVKQSPVLWIDFDNGKRRTHERFEALAKARNLSEDTPIFYYSLPMPWLNAGNLSDIEALERRIIARNARIVVVDNLGLITPAADENSADMIQVMSHFRILAENTGAAISLIHHTRKNNGITARAGESLRGHSSIESAIDLALRVDREADSNFITIQSTKSRDNDVAQFGAEFRFEHKFGTNELSEATFSAAEMDDTTSDKAIKRAIIEIVRDNPMLNQKELKKEVKNSALQVGDKRLWGIVKSMEKNRQLKTRSGLHGAIEYYVHD